MDVLGEVARERERQDKLWGEQNHEDFPDYIGCDVPTADMARRRCDARFKNGMGTWWDIALEEVSEVAAEIDNDPEELRKELVQLAAVCVAWIQAIDRRDGVK